MKRVWKVLLCVAIISSMLLTSVFAYPDLDKPGEGGIAEGNDHWVTLGNVENARDLGGYTATIDGKEYKIKDEVLFRSGHLKDADVSMLNNYHISKVIDLRTSLEALRKPDVKDSHIKNVSISMLTIPNLFVLESADWKTLLGAIKSGIMETWDANLYRQYIQDPSAYKATRKFFDEVLDSAGRGEPVLWHCTAGKDRTGIEAMLLMAALGCDYETILGEFLQTNVFYEGKAMERYDEVDKIIHIKAIATEFFKYEIVQKKWLEISMDVMKRMTNTSSNDEALDAYLTNVIKLSDVERETLRKAYLDGYAQVENTQSENVQTFESLSDAA